MHNISIIGTGYVGLVTGTCFADLGNRVICMDIVEEKIRLLQAGHMPIFEPGLEELVRRNVKSGRLTFTTSYEEAIHSSGFVFIAVNTPSGAGGEADLKYERLAIESIADVLQKYTIIVNKSTVPVGTGDWVAEIMESRGKRRSVDFDVVSNPEFLREGSAITDFTMPDRVVLGATNPKAAEAVAQLHLSLRCPIMITDLRTAEMIKYASNAFLATRISFINEIAAICERLGADVKEVAVGMGYDRRIGRAFLEAGLGYGGSCFPKDVKALEYMAAASGCHPQLLRAVMEINRDQRRQVVLKLRQALTRLTGKTIGVLGLSFKPNTDDMRDAPSLEIIGQLLREGVTIKAYDPVAAANARRDLPDITYCDDPYAVADGSDALVLVTEWNEFKQLDMARIKDSMRQPVLVDGRNMYEPAAMRALGFTYLGIGRG
jgi:UDPglucose 6-dehydrogenase